MGKLALAAQKRYRFTGKERDEESGLNYHLARYCSLWTGRWLSCDPSFASPGKSTYEYSNSCPICRVDPNGTDDKIPNTISDDDLVPNYPIYPGAVNILSQHLEVEHNRVGDVVQPNTYRDVGLRILNRSGLKSLLEERVQGPLTSFEKSLVDNWGEDSSAVLTPIQHYPEGFFYTYCKLTALHWPQTRGKVEFGSTPFTPGVDTEFVQRSPAVI